PETQVVGHPGEDIGRGSQDGFARSRGSGLRLVRRGGCGGLGSVGTLGSDLVVDEAIPPEAAVVLSRHAGGVVDGVASGSRRITTWHAGWLGWLGEQRGSGTVVGRPAQRGGAQGARGLGGVGTAVPGRRCRSG